MADELPIWRQALNDPEHPFYQAAWLIFSGTGSPEYMTKVLEPRKEEVIPFLLTILREPELYKEKSLGMGKAPFRTMTTLIDWKVMEALPDLFKSVEYSELHEEMIDEDGEYEGDFDAYDAIESIFQMMDEAFAEPLLQLKDTLEDDRLIAVTAWKLSIFRPEDRSVFDWITRSIDRVEDEWEKLNLIESLLRMKIPENIKWAENYAKRKEHPQHFKISLRNRIKEATGR